MKLFLASNNAHKLAEVSAVLGPLGFEVHAQNEFFIDMVHDQKNVNITCSLLYLQTPNALDVEKISQYTSLP